jgi:hypothetical protein
LSRTDPTDPTRRIYLNEKTAIFWQDQLPASSSTILDIRSPGSAETPSQTSRPSVPDSVEHLKSASIGSSPTQNSTVSGTDRGQVRRLRTDRPGSASSISTRVVVEKDLPAPPPPLPQLTSGRSPGGVQSLTTSPEEVAFAQRLEQLGPIPQVLGALQMLIRRDNTNIADPELPRYEEPRR